METVKEKIKKFAKEAGRFLLKEYKKARSYGRFQSKEAKSLYDKASELLIKKLIWQEFPEHSVLAEETGYEERDPSYVWIVDPLDGTANFINTNPFFAVSIALQIDNKLRYAAIYAPVLEEFYYAEYGKGAYMNNAKLQVSKVGELSRAYIVHCEGSETNRKRLAKLHYEIVSKVLDFRKLGSAALECAFVASARADAYVTTKISPWDVAAGILLVEEAKGKISDFKGNSWKIEKTDLLVSNGYLHEKMLKLLKNI